MDNRKPDGTEEKSQAYRPGILSDRHFYISLTLFALCAIVYYFGELVNYFNWDALRWEIFYTVHDPHRLLFLAPILYSSYYYRFRGAFAANLLVLVIFLPRSFLISPYPDATLRMGVFVVAATVISLLIVIIFNNRDKQKEAADNLTKSEQKYRGILDDIHDAYMDVDLSGNFTLLNNSACRNLGYSREELLGKNFSMIMGSKEDETSVFTAFHMVYQSGAPHNGLNFKVKRKDGNTGYTETSISLIRDKQGKPVGFHTLGRDVTERKHNEDELKIHEAQLQSLVNILQHEATSLQDFLDYALEEAIKITSSKIGYIYYYDEATTAFTLNSWSRDVMQECTIAEKKTHYQLEKTGIWGEAVRQRKPIVVNDFQEPHPLKKGYPEGHAQLYKYLTVPVFLGKQIVAVVGVANKETDYTQTDILQLTLLMDSVWKATYRKQMEALLKENEEKYRLLAESSDDIIWTLDNQLNITYVSPSVLKMVGYEPELVTGHNISEFFEPEQFKQIMLVIESNRAGLEKGDDRSVRLEREWQRKDGSTFWIETVARAIYSPSNQHTGYLGVSRNITERKEFLQKLEALAMHDAMTGLPNRVLLYDRFSMVAASARRNEKKFAIMSLDLDKFKLINDTMGHDAGDKLLTAAAMRLTGSLRKSDTVARIGGDEFVIILPDIGDKDAAANTAEKLLRDFRQPFDIAGHMLNITISIGISLFPDDGSEIEELLKASDKLLYEAKQRGRNTYAI